MTVIRALQPEDLPALADLRRQAFRTSRLTEVETLAYLREVFLENPWRDPELPSLVYEEDGRPLGFIGIIPRPMTHRGRPLRAVVSTQFMVDPTARGMPAIKLMQRLFAGPQDLTLGDAAPDAMRRMWEGFGGATSVVHSLFWHRPLRPLRDSTAAWGGAPVTRVARLALRPLLAAADALAVRWPGAAYRLLEPPGAASPIALENVADLVPVVLRRRPVRPAYDAATLRWLTSHLVRSVSPAELQVRRVDVAGKPVGWFTYVANPGGVSNAVQVAAADDQHGAVLAHLFRDAWQIGSFAVRSRLDPQHLGAVTAASCVLGRDGPWVLVHSRHAEVLQAFLTGDAWVSGIDGERWLAF